MFIISQNLMHFIKLFAFNVIPVKQQKTLKDTQNYLND